jgi:FkbM family methyltransferase
MLVIHIMHVVVSGLKENNMNPKYLKLSKYVNFLRRKIFGIAHIGYSQCGEDIILDYLLKHKENGVYVDIGANDPRIFSNTYFFYKKGWSGVVVEPNEDKLKLFNFFRPRDTKVQAAIDKEGVMTLYKFKEDPLNTTSKEVADSYTKMGHKIIATEKINTIPLSKLFESNNLNQVDILSVDTEGQNLSVLKTNDWNIYRPHFVVVETAEYDTTKDVFKEEEFDTYMKEQKYQKVASTRINGIYQKCS